MKTYRIGQIVPSSNTTMETELPRMMRAREEVLPQDRFTFHSSRMRMQHVTPEELRAILSPHLNRDFARLSPIERAILYIGSFELTAHPETPFKVVLNEAVELGKSFGATDGYRFVNGVLEKVAAELRPDEFARARTDA